jgi:hypothetical protein
MNIKPADLGREEVRPGRPTIIDEDVPPDSLDLVKNNVIALVLIRASGAKSEMELWFQNME